MKAEQGKPNPCSDVRTCGVMGLTVTDELEAEVCLEQLATEGESPVGVESSAVRQDPRVACVGNRA